MNQTVKDALRIAKSPRKPVRFHHTVARKGYEAGGHPEGVVDEKATETVWQQPQAPAPVTQPDDAHQEAFLKEQLKGSAPQYDPAAGMHTAKEAGLMAAGMVPGTGLAAAAGKFPTAEGGFEPSLKEDISAGHYGSAFLKGLGAAGDIAQAVPVVGTAAGAAMKAPLAIKLASAMAPAARLAREATPAAKAAEEVAPIAREAEAALPPAGVTGEVSVAPEMTKSQSQAAMKAAWEAGQGDTSKYKTWNHQWNVEEGPKFKAQQVEAAPTPTEAPVVPTTEVPAYQRLINPAGFYSRAHEAAMTELPADPRTWTEMYSLLSKAPRVQAEELYWSGLHPEAFPASDKVTREQIAELIQKNFPMVEPQIRTTALPEEYVTAKQEFISQDKNVRRLMNDYKAAREAENFPTGIPTGAYALLDSAPERQAMYIERAPESMQPIMRELVAANDSFREATAKFEEAEAALPPRLNPKYERYTVPGGTDYEERILRHQYSPESGSQASEAVFQKYVPELQRLNERAFDNSLSLEERQAARQQHADLLEKANAEADSVAPEYTKQKYRHGHWDDTTNPVVHTRNSTRTGPNGEKIWHQEEIQSDWAQEGREKGFQPEPLSSKEKKELDELMSRVGPDSSPEDKARYQELSTRDVGNITKSGIPRAPYTRDTEHWLELAAKDTLKEAIERGYDKIFITGGQEQAKRWANELRKSIDNVRWELSGQVWKGFGTPQEQEAALQRFHDTRSVWSRMRPSDPRHEEAQREFLEAERAMKDIVPGWGRAEGDKPQEGDVSKVVYFTRSGSGREGFLKVQPVEQPNGKLQYKVVDSDIPQAKGETLSSVIGSDLAKRVMAEESGDVPMKGYVMGSEGYTQTYERKAPSIYKKLLKSLDPEARIEAGPLNMRVTYDFPEVGLDAFSYFDAKPGFNSKWNTEHDMIINGLSAGKTMSEAVDQYASPEFAEWLAKTIGAGRRIEEGGVGGTYITITPKMRAEYNRLKQKFGSVFPAYKRGGKVDGKPRVRYTQPEDALRISRKYAQ